MSCQRLSIAKCCEGDFCCSTNRERRLLLLLLLLLLFDEQGTSERIRLVGAAEAAAAEARGRAEVACPDLVILIDDHDCG